MRTSVDAAGRLVIVKEQRDAVGLSGGGASDISVYGTGLQITRAGRTAALRRIDGHLVVDPPDPFPDEILFDLIDAARRSARPGRDTLAG